MLRWSLILLLIFIVVSLARPKGDEINKKSMCKLKDKRDFCKCDYNTCWGRNTYGKCRIRAVTEAAAMECVKVRDECSCACSKKYDKKKEFGDICSRKAWKKNGQ